MRLLSCATALPPSFWFAQRPERPTWRFREDKELLSYDVNKNLCYCPGFKHCLEKNADTDEWDKSNCTEDEVCRNGLLYVKGCYGARMVMSQPHFFHCDEDLVNAVDGMHPNEDEHDTFLDGKLSNT